MTGEAEAEPHWSGRRRAPAYAVVRQRWPIGLLAVSLNLGLTYVLLVVSLRSVGIAASEIGPAVTFASFAVAFFAGVVIAITGSGLGVVDVVLVSALSASAMGGVDVNVIVAAVVIWRLFYGLLAFLRGPRHPQPVLPGAPGPPR